MGLQKTHAILGLTTVVLAGISLQVHAMPFWEPQRETNKQAQKEVLTDRTATGAAEIMQHEQPEPVEALIEPASGEAQSVQKPLINPYPAKSVARPAPSAAPENRTASVSKVVDVPRVERRKPRLIENWEVSAGAPAKDVLAKWSQQAGVDLIWNVQDEFKVMHSMRIEGSYEDAVRLLLEQFDNEPKRPVGSLHIDQKDDKRALVIETLNDA